MEYRQYKLEINDTRCKGGQYWTNIVASYLKDAATALGKDEANHLIRDCNLKAYGWKEEV